MHAAKCTPRHLWLRKPLWVKTPQAIAPLRRNIRPSSVGSWGWFSPDRECGCSTPMVCTEQVSYKESWTSEQATAEKWLENVWRNLKNIPNQNDYKTVGTHKSSRKMHTSRRFLSDTLRTEGTRQWKRKPGRIARVLTNWVNLWVHLVCGNLFWP